MKKMMKKTKTMTTKKKTAKRTAPARRSKPAAKKVLPVPAGYHAVTPYIVCDGAAAAIAFYKQAFGAKERSRMAGPDGRLMHAEIAVGDSMIMLADENPQMGTRSPKSLGATSAGLFIYTADVDKAYAKAIAAGATSVMPPANMFWGDRYCTVNDPFGHRWSIATHIEDMSVKEMLRRGAEEMAKRPAPPAAS